MCCPFKQVVTVEDLYENGDDPRCSSSAMVVFKPKTDESFFTSSGKAQVQVTAEDVASPGHVLRAQVIVNLIHSLQIMSHTKEVLLEEAPVKFSIIAFDSKGNAFSTLNSLVFKWDAKDRDDVVRMVKFRDSQYSVSPELDALEGKGLQGDHILYEGIKTGSAKVSVALMSKAPAKVQPTEITVMVIENLYLVPHAAYVMIGAVVDYHAEQIKGNKVS